MATQIVKERVGQSLIFVAPATTLAINPWGNYDPISVVKMTVLSSMSFLVLSLLIFGKLIRKDKESNFLIKLCLIFVIWMFAVVLFSGAPISQQIWGMFGRNTGLLTYSSLTIVLLAAAVLKDFEFYRKLIWSLLLTAIPMTLYCLLQIYGKDPIGWSLFQTFGTLGNINFLSAFLGLVCIIATSVFLSSDSGIASKLFLASLTLIDLYIIKSTGSIQGIMMYLVGLSVIAFFWLGRFGKKTVIFRWFFTLIILAGAVISVMGLADRGPLEGILFQESNVLRTDYWHAGWAMTMSHPLFGVGMDSYGDWYRQMRGEISTLRGSADRTANTAHNIFLDISSNGGFLLLVIYLLILLLVLNSILRLLRRGWTSFDCVAAGLSAAWIAYQVQALISINQVGVGIWGWIFSGALIGYEKCQNSNSNSAQNNLKFKNRLKKQKGQLLPAHLNLAAILGFLIGVMLAFPAISSDARFFTAMKSKSLNNLVESSSSFGATAWHIGRVIESAMQANKPSEAREANIRLTSKFPRDYFGWLALYNLPNSTDAERKVALLRLRTLDPFNPANK